MNRLEETLCIELGLNQPHQYHLFKSEKNPLTSYLEIAKNPRPFQMNEKDSIENILERFYKEEGFKVDSENGIKLNKNNKKYSIQILEGDSSYKIHINEARRFL